MLFAFTTLAGSGCSTARPVLTFLFVGVPEEGKEFTPLETGRPVRRQPYQKVVKERPPDLGVAREVKDWPGLFAALPRSESGDVQWVKALEGKQITPSSGLAPDAKDEDPTDMDTELATSGQAEYKVMFPHKAHTLWMGCPSCHTGIFEMEKGKSKMTMAAMNEGKQCGVCHRTVALPDLNGCPVCHTEMGKG